MVVTLGEQYNVGEKPTVMLYTYNCYVVLCLVLLSGSSIGESKSVVECTI